MRTFALAIVIAAGMTGVALAQPPQSTPPTTEGIYGSKAGTATTVESVLCSEPTVCLPQCCCPHERCWAKAEYLMWWIKDGPLPVPLVTISPSASFAVLDQPGTSILFGNGSIDHDVFSGGRFTLGSWLNKDKNIGLEGNFLFLAKRSDRFFAGGDGTADLAIGRPIVNTITGAETALLVAFPTGFAGGVAISSSSQLWGSEVNVRGKLSSNELCTVSGLVGFRYADLTEDIGILQASTILPGGISFFNGTPVLAPNTVTLLDRFNTRNQFYGGQVGLDAEVSRKRWSLDMLAKIAAGSTHEVVSVNGNTTVSGPGIATATTTGGLLALPSNIGRQVQDRFAVIPEVGATLGVQVTPRLRATVGYTFLYWSEVVRPGDQINRVVNPAQLPSAAGFGPLVGAPEPTPRFEHTDYWAQGVNFGLSLRY